MARYSEKGDGPFFCPECHGEVILRKGRVKVHHFAHKPPITCQYGTGESEEHRLCKQQIYDSLLYNDQIQNLELEKRLGSVIPDIYFETGPIKVAIEVQISNLNMNRIIERTKEYHDLGIYVLWLAKYKETLSTEIYSPRQWEKWLHAVNFGRLYYWTDGLNVKTIHFDDYQIWVEYSNWYTSDGDEMSAGGYFRKSKRFRTPNFGAEMNLLKDFKREMRKAWQGGDIYIPNCKILVDKHLAWWK